MIPYGGGAADFATYNGRISPGQGYTVWTAKAGGTQITGVIDALGVPLVGDFVFSDSRGMIEFQVPDGNVPVYLHAMGDPTNLRVRLDPANIASTLTGSVADVGTLQDQMGVAQGSILALQSSVAAAQTDIDGIETDITSLEDQIAAIEGGTEIGVFLPETYGAVGDGVNDDAPAVQDALDAAFAAGGGEVVLSPGRTYLLSSLRAGQTSMLFVRAKTVLTAYGATVRRGAGYRMLCNYDGVTSTGVYTGHGDIVLRGGLWDAFGGASGGRFNGLYNTITFAHCEGVVVQDLEVRDVPNYHAIEFNSAKRARIFNCVFAGQYDVDGTHGFREAIQIDQANSGGSTALPYDGTPCVDVIVSDCTMLASAVNGPHGVFVGTHPGGSTPANSEGVQIINNVVQDYRYYGIRVAAMNRVLVQGNTITGTGRIGTRSGIAVTQSSNPNAMSGVFIKDNIVRNTGHSAQDYAAIHVMGDSGVEVGVCQILGNHVLSHTGIAGIYAVFASRCQIRDNHVAGGTVSTAGTFDGIVVRDSRAAHITENVITTPPNVGILTETGSANVNESVIRGNFVYFPFGHGMHLRGNDCSVTGNTITNANNGNTASTYGVVLDGKRFAFYGNKVIPAGTSAPPLATESAKNLAAVKLITGATGHAYGNNFAGWGSGAAAPSWVRGVGAISAGTYGSATGLDVAAVNYTANT